MEFELITPHSHIIFDIIESINGARFAKKSSEKSDSSIESISLNGLILGEKDLKLAKMLSHTSVASGHDKFLQSINFMIDISWSRYMWQEFDTYRVGVSKQSESTMHTITKDNLSIKDFDIDRTKFCSDFVYNLVLNEIEKFLNKVKYWKSIYENENITDTEFRELIKNTIPESFIQKRRVSMNYATVKLINAQRKNHRNIEWRELIKYFKEILPFSEIIFEENKE